LRGALNEELFVDSGAEMWFTFAKLQPFLKDVRQNANSPHLYARIEKVATRTKDARERMQMMAKRAESMRARAAKA
jgi:ferritin-like metal-binding protein YciE